MESVLKLDLIAGDKKRIWIYQTEQEGLIFPEIPEFKKFEEERQYRKKHLVAACCAFAEHKFLPRHFFADQAYALNSP